MKNNKKIMMVMGTVLVAFSVSYAVFHSRHIIDKPIASQPSSFQEVIAKTHSQETEVIDKTISDSIGNREGSSETLLQEELSPPSTLSLQNEFVDLDPSRIPDRNPKFDSLADRITMMESRRSSADYSVADIAEAVKQSEAWQVMGSVPLNIPLSEEELYDGKRDFIRTRPMRIESLAEGDEITLPNPEGGQDFTLVIQSVEVDTENNTVSWLGHLKEFESGSEFNMTRGETLTVGSVSTPDHDYSFELFDDEGWIASTNSLFTEESEPIVPPGEEGGEHLHD